MPARPASVLLSRFDDADGFDTGFSHALLEQVSAGVVGETFRITVPGPVVAFGKRDAVAPGFDRAVGIARDHGYTPIVRLPGGRAAVFHEGTVSFSWTVPIDDPVAGSRDRFAATAALIVRTLEHLGISSQIGEIPGEYCPGAFSVNHAGRIKLAGIGQRVVRGAAHVGGVLVVRDASRTAGVLVPLYEALGLPLDPSTIGAVEDAVPGVDPSAAVSALLSVLGERAAVTVVEPAASTLDLARDLAPSHLPRSSRLA